MGSRVDLTTLGEELNVCARMAVVRCDESNRAMQVLVVVPADKALDPGDGVGKHGEALGRVARPVLQSSEQGFDVGLSSLTLGRLKDGTMPNHCMVLSMDEPFIGLPLSA